MSTGAKVQFSPTMFNSAPTLSAPTQATTIYGPTMDMKAYRPSGEGRSLLADVGYSFRMFDATGTERWNNQVRGLVVNTGLTQLITAGLLAAPWYLLLVDGASAPVFTPTDTMASHAGWTEQSADYSQATRPVITFSTPAVNGVTDNSAAQAEFSFTTSGVIYGAGICSLDTKGVDSGTLYDVGAFTDGTRTYGAGWNLYLAVTCSVGAA